MAKAPTYQDLNRQRAENKAMQEQQSQKASVAQETQMVADANINPVLYNYLNPTQNNVQQAQQGLEPSVMDEQLAYGFTRRDLENAGVPLEQQNQLTESDLQEFAVRRQNNFNRGLGSMGTMQAQ